MESFYLAGSLIIESAVAGASCFFRERWNRNSWRRLLIRLRITKPTPVSVISPSTMLSKPVWRKRFNYMPSGFVCLSIYSNDMSLRRFWAKFSSAEASVE